MTRAEFLALARTWLGTPYHNQARLKGVGADCIGFIIGAASEATGRAITAPCTYGRYPAPVQALAAIRASGECITIPLVDAKPGDVVYMRIAREPQHFGILGEAGTLIHCIESAGVVEVNFVDWMKANVVHVFSLVWLED